VDHATADLSSTTAFAPVDTAVVTYPEGWFRVAPAFPCGEVRTVRAFGRELVLFRTASGRAGAVDPYCPHAGAHLGHGGRVEGEQLRCPFHGLHYGADGRCRQDPRDRSAVASWPVEIWQGQLMVYFGAGEPDWRLPQLPHAGWSLPHWRTLRLIGHVQDVAENGVDFRHFVTVHHYSNLRQPHIDIEGRRLHSRFGFDRRHPLRRGVVSAVFDTDIWGLGCSITDLRAMGLHFRLLLLATQIDERKLDFSIGISLENGFPGEGLLRRFMLRTIIADVMQDKEIWAYRRHPEKPALTAEDAAVVAFRRYAQQFYATD
jgi:nitrite reductase/ring-hydroxylating ferredoxin subunit